MRSSPAIVAALLLAWPARAEPALWHVDSPTAKIYLFGTMHILPKPAQWFGPKIAAAFAASGTLWEEADIGFNDPSLASRVMAEATSPDYDLWAELAGPYADKFHTELKSCGLPDEAVTHVRPWMAAMMASICQMMAKAGGKLGPMRDNPEALLLDKARAAGKLVAYFETAEQQIGYLAQASQAAQLGQLRQAIDEAAGTKDNFAETETAWLNGDVAAIAAFVAQSERDDKAFYETVFPQRNARFCARIADMLNSHGTIFVAIGAGHLAGPDSVIACLQQRGVKAQQD
jgi:uncharacterized protein YbaP (TraB family)